MQTNANLMTAARETLRGKWGLAIGAAFLCNIASILFQSIPRVGWVVSLLISGPITLGAIIFFLAFSRNQDAKLEQIVDGFKNFKTALFAHLWMTLFIILWSLLLIIPGIVAAYNYSLTFYIIADDKSIGFREAVKKSKKMMKGNLVKLLYLQLRFVGWVLLSILTLGIGLLWVMPYMAVSMAKFYDDVKSSQSTDQTPAQPSAEKELKEVMTEKK